MMVVIKIIANCRDYVIANVNIALKEPEFFEVKP